MPSPGGIRTHNPRKRAAADPHLRPRGATSALAHTPSGTVQPRLHSVLVIRKQKCCKIFTLLGCYAAMMWSSRYSCQILMKLEFYQQVFRKKMVRNEASWKLVQLQPRRSTRTDSHDEADSRFIANLRTRLNSDAFSTLREPQAAAKRVSQFVCDTDCTCYSHINHGEDVQH